jgi:nitroimidazol reductase NimA-like FMN-containing flavoprotein (pyridoxamine 5'-phosphate oxidase superfamily)
VFSALDEVACWDLLARNHVGRLAFFNHGVVDIEPVNYVLEDSWLFLRSRHGTKLEVFAHHPYVAIEVDEIRSDLDWQSVVAHGTVYIMSAKALGVDHVVYERALRALRSYMPAALTAADPLPGRTVVYGIHIERVTGREGGRHARPRRRARPMAAVATANDRD